MTERTPQPPYAGDLNAAPSFLDDPTLAQAPFAVFVWDEDLDGFVWANGAGLNRWGALSLASLRASRLDRAMPAMAKLRDLSRMALPVEGVVQTLTFWTPRGACRMTCRCRPLDLNDGGHGLVLEAVDQHTGPEADAPVRDRGNSLVNGRPAYLPAACRTGRVDQAPRPDRASTHVPGYLSGVDRTATPGALSSNGRASPDLPSPSDDDHFAMQEIARMLARDTSGGVLPPVSRADVLPTQTQDVPQKRVASPVLPKGHAATSRPGQDSGARLRVPRPAERSENEGSGTYSLPAVDGADDDTSSHRFDTLNHELRTPLSSIIGFAEMMHREQLGPIGNARYKEYAGDILDSARHALSLINDLLDASRVRAGHLDAAAEEIDVPTLLDRVIALMAPQAQTASVTVVRGYPPALPVLKADARALRQILLNLLTNAFKFTPEGGHVFVSAKHDETHMVLDIRDTGIGMTEAQIADALKPWVRGNGEAVLPSKPVGSGLGLPLVKALTEAQNGELSVTSAPGEGTCVTVRLPLH